MTDIDELSFEHKARDLARKLHGELVDVEKPNRALVRWPCNNSQLTASWFELTTDDEWQPVKVDLETLLASEGCDSAPLDSCQN